MPKTRRSRHSHLAPIRQRVDYYFGGRQRLIVGLTAVSCGCRNQLLSPLPPQQPRPLSHNDVMGFLPATSSLTAWFEVIDSKPSAIMNSFSLKKRSVENELVSILFVINKLFIKQNYRQKCTSNELNLKFDAVPTPSGVLYKIRNDELQSYVLFARANPHGPGGFKPIHYTGNLVCKELN